MKKRLEIMKSLMQYMREEKKLLAGIGLVKVVLVLLSLIPPMLYKLLLNDVLINRHLEIFGYIVAGYLAVCALMIIANVISKRFSNKSFRKLNLKIVLTMLKQFMNSDYEKISSYNDGDLRNYLDNDVESVERFFLRHIINYFFSYANLLLITIILLWIEWRLAVISILLIPITYYVSDLLTAKIASESMIIRNMYGKYEGFLHNSLEHWKEVKLSGIQESIMSIFNENWSKLSKHILRRQVLGYSNRAFVAFKDYLVTQLGLYFIGGLLVINGRMEIAALIVFMQYFNNYLKLIAEIIELNNSFSEDLPSIERVLDVLGWEIDTRTNSNLTDNKISLMQVSYRYSDNQDYALKNITLDIPHIGYHAIVGKSGSGKSTMAKLLVGLLRSYSGTIKLSDYDLVELDQVCMNKKISMIMQEPYFFNQSIRENMRLANSSSTDDDILKACELANVKDLILNMPEKLETVIGEKGTRLSGGQRQRLAIARMLLYDPDIIIFDEATSALDINNEYEIRKVIKKISEYKTVIVIAHRLSSVIDSDNIIVFEQGEILAIGKHDELMQRNKTYNEIFSSQQNLINNTDLILLKEGTL